MGRYNEWIGQEAPEGSWRKGWWGEEVTLFEGEYSIDFQEMSSVLILKSKNYGHNLTVHQAILNGEHVFQLMDLVYLGCEIPFLG